MDNIIRRQIQVKANLNGVKILLAEDERLDILIAQKILTNLGAEVEVVKTGWMAVEKVKTEEFDIILMDYIMPIMNGLEATKSIREFNNTIPILFVTSDLSQVIRSDFAGLNISEIIYKPFDPEFLYQTIWKILSKLTNK